MRAWFLLLLLCLAAPSAGGDDWPMPRHDARNTGYTASEVRPPLRLAWKVALPEFSALSTSLLSSGGVVCASGHGEVVLYSASGKRLWQLPAAAPVYLKDDLLVIAARTGERGFEVRGYSWPKQQLLWAYQRQDRLSDVQGAVEQEGVLYLSLSHETRPDPQQPESVRMVELLALDLRTGTEQARRSYANDWGLGPPAIDSERVYWGLGDWLHVLNRSDLQPRLAYSGGGNTMPMVVGMKLITQGWAHAVSALEPLSGRVIWRRSVWRGAGHCLAQGKDGARVLVEADPDPPRVVGLDPDTGEVLWSHALIAGGYGDSPPAAGSGRYVYVPGHHLNVPGRKRQVRGGLYCFDAGSGKLVWKYQRPDLYGLQVIVSDGAIYAASDRALYKFVPVR